MLAARVRSAVLEGTGLLPDRVLLLEPGTLPRTSSGKLRRRETLMLHLAGKLAPPRKVTPMLLAGAWIKSMLAFRRARQAKKTQTGGSGG